MKVRQFAKSLYDMFVEFVKKVRQFAKFLYDMSVKFVKKSKAVCEVSL